MKTRILTLLAAVLLGGTALAEENWISLFNGKNLDGWIPKVVGAKAGENPGNIFRVQDGLLTVSYDAFDKFEGRFGHLHTAKAYKNYRFRCEYRFIGEQSPGGPGWAFANNGIMLHCPHPSKMEIDQSFPNSAEFQLLGVKRTTGSLFTPGCKVTYEGKDMGKAIKSKLPALPLGEWVVAEAVVKDGKIQHWINGQLVMEYTNPRYDDGTPMVEGHISLQAESHPTQFRYIEILILD
ncbi:MAG: DUF1080 domain-containing protein [Kiritimatiellales bacterium]|nr:DUF1080 domain-containing protein [Kiritimatiellales bacterium]